MIGRMAHYFVGDIQGCDEALQRLLDRVDFSPSRDVLLPVGDLVNRGPQSLAVLRRLHALGTSALPVLGNHDLHLLAVHCGGRALAPKDTLGAVLAAPDRAALLTWLSEQPLARQMDGVLMVHAGVLPPWTVAQTLALAQEVQSAVQQAVQAQDAGFWQQMYGNRPRQWRDDLAGMDRIRVVINGLTRLRFCSDAGEMEFDTKESASQAPAGYRPWFEVKGRQTQHQPIAFGHWSTLGRLGDPLLWSLDSGCVWGGHLTAVRPSALGQAPTWFSVPALADGSVSP
jgi:bis(5'-nucleosyl)-tetraphosphatase (symmetrical)